MTTLHSTMLDVVMPPSGTRTGQAASGNKDGGRLGDESAAMVKRFADVAPSDAPPTRWEEVESRPADQIVSAGIEKFVGDLDTPSLHDLACELLGAVGLDPKGLVAAQSVPQENALRENALKESTLKENALKENPRENAARYYVCQDALSAEDLRRMSNRPLSQADIELILNKLPPSLTAEFNKRFDIYADNMSARVVQYLRIWIVAAARQYGIDDLANANISVSRAFLDCYAPDVDLHHPPTSASTKLIASFESKGYFVSIHTAGVDRRFFLSGLSRSVRPIPLGELPAPWMQNYRTTVFDEAEIKERLGDQRNAVVDRVVIEELGCGAYRAMEQWLTPFFRKEGESLRGVLRELPVDE